MQLLLSPQFNIIRKRMSSTQSGKLYATDSSDQFVLGQSNKITISAPIQSSQRRFIIPQIDKQFAYFLLTEGDQVVAGKKVFSDEVHVMGKTYFTGGIQTEAIRLPNVAGNGILVVDNEQKLASRSLTNGQLLIGSTDVLPVVGNIVGSDGQIISEYKNGNIVLSLSPGMNLTTINLTNPTNQLKFGSGNTITLNSITPISSRIYDIPDVGSNSYFIMGDGLQIMRGILRLSSLTSNSLLSLNSLGNITSNVLSNGQLLIGNSGSSPTPGSIIGTSGEINVNYVSGNIKLSLANSNSANPNFTSVTLVSNNNQLVFGHTSSSTVTINVNTPSSSKVYTIPESSSSTSQFIISDGPVKFNNYNVNSVLTLDATHSLVAQELKDGQILIGSTGLIPSVSYITGTQDQIKVTNGPGSIQISLDNSNGLALNSNKLIFGTSGSTSTTVTSIASLNNPVYTIPSVGTNAEFVMTEGTQVINGMKSFTNTTQFLGLSNNSLLYLDPNNNVTSGSIVGTSGQIIVNNNSGNYTLSLASGAGGGGPYPSLNLTGTSNQLTFGQTSTTTSTTTTLSVTTPSSSRTYTIPDAGNNASFVMTESNQTINGNKTLSGTTKLSGVTSSSILYLDSSNNISAGSISGTSGQIIVNNNSGNYTLSLASGAGGNTFNNLNITGTTSQLSFATSTSSTTSTTITVTSPASAHTYTIPDAGSNASFVMTESNQTINGNKTLSGTTKLSNVTSSSLLYLDSSNNIVAGSLLGTSGQIIVTNNSGAYTLSLAGGAGGNTFNSLNLANTSNQIVVGTSGTTTTVSFSTASSSHTYTVSDVGNNANFVMTEGVQTINGNKTLSGTTKLSNVTASSILYLDSSNNITNGSLSGTAGQIVVNNNSGSYTFSLANSSSINSLNLSNTTSQLSFGSTSGTTSTTITVTNPVSARTYTIPDAGSNATFVMSESNQTINGNKTLSGTTKLSGVTSSSLLYLDSSNNITAGNIQGTSGQINVANNSGVYTLSLASGAGGNTFNSLNLTNTSSQLLFATSTSSTTSTTITVTTPSASRTYTVPDAGNNASFVMSEGNQTINGNKTLSGTTKLSGVTSSSLLYLDSNNNITNGSISGTTNQINVNNSNGAYTLSLPSTGVTTSTLILSNTSNQLTIGTSATTTTLSVTTPSASRIYTVPDVGSNSNFVMSNGNQTVSGTKTFSSQIPITVTSNQIVLGSSNTITLNANVPSASRTYTIQDVGSDSSFLMLDGAQTISGVKTFANTVNVSNLSSTNTNISTGTCGLLTTSITTTGNSNLTPSTNMSIYQSFNVAGSFTQTDPVSVYAGNNNAGANSTGLTVGWGFTAASTFTISRLKLDVATFGSGTVAVYTTSGTLLTSSTITTSSPLSGSMRYAQISSGLTFTSGTTYIIAANATSIPGNATGTATLNSSYISSVQLYQSNAGTLYTLQFPSNSVNGSAGKTYGTLVGIEIGTTSDILNVSTSGINMGTYSITCGSISCSSITSTNQSYIMFKSTATTSLTPTTNSLLAISTSDTTISTWSTTPYKTQGTVFVTNNGSTFQFGASAAGIYSVSYLIPIAGNSVGSRKIYINLASDSTIQYAKRIEAGIVDGNSMFARESLVIANNDSLTIKIAQTALISLSICDAGAGACYVIFEKIC